MTDVNSIKPEIRKVNLQAPGFTGSSDPRFKGVRFEVPAKLVRNSPSDMALTNLYSKGALKAERTGRVCRECVNYYPDPNINKKQGRCKARGFMRVSEDTPADERNDWTDPASGIWFSNFPACPYFLDRDRLSLK